jgi:hypothetical protein
VQKEKEKEKEKKKVKNLSLQSPIYFILYEFIELSTFSAW